LLLTLDQRGALQILVMNMPNELWSTASNGFKTA